MSISGRTVDKNKSGPILLASSVFLLASAGCGWAPSMPFFIGARALSGVGAGGMTGLSFIIVADSFPIGEWLTLPGLM